MTRRKAAIASLLPASIAGIFELMGIAEEEIANGKTRHPTRAAEIHGVFRFSCPSASLRDKGAAVYRAHVRELVDRASRGEDLNQATEAEILSAMSDASLVAPPSRDFAAAMETLFCRVTGRNICPRATESYPGAAREIIEQARRKIGPRA